MGRENTKHSIPDSILATIAFSSNRNEFEETEYNEFHPDIQLSGFNSSSYYQDSLDREAVIERFAQKLGIEFNGL
jgi:hypothetical protein